MNPNINYPSIFNGFYHDARPSFPTYTHTYEAPYTEEHEHQDYTFLPKPTFFDHFVGSPLDVTRQSTEATEANDNALLAQKPISPHAIPYPKYNLQGYDHAFTGLNVKPVEMVQNRYAEGTHFHAYNSVLDSPFFQNQHAQHVQACPPPNHALANAVKVEDKVKVVPKIEKSVDEDLEEEQAHSPEVMLNAQLKSLLDSKLWSEEKDQMLLKLGAQYKCDWKKISKRFNNKKITPHFLKIRYKELTCAPLQRRVKFNHREDLMIAKYFEKYGSNWAQMAVHFKDRSAIMLKNRYYSFIRKRELLDALLQEVKEFEKNDQEVDSLKDSESERYIEMFSSQRGLAAYREDSDQALGSAEHGMETSIQQRNQENEHHIFGFERKNPENMSLVGRDKNVMVTGSKVNTDGKAGTPEDKKMVGLLKARVKSLQALYLTTKAELDKLKMKN